MNLPVFTIYTSKLPKIQIIGWKVKGSYFAIFMPIKCIHIYSLALVLIQLQHTLIFSTFWGLFFPFSVSGTVLGLICGPILAFPNPNIVRTLGKNESKSFPK
jgi:hypothetical protein